MSDVPPSGYVAELVAEQVAEFFAERGLEPVIVAGAPKRLHAVRPGEQEGRVPLCTPARREVRDAPDLLRVAEGKQLLWRQCRQCARIARKARVRGLVP